MSWKLGKKLKESAPSILGGHKHHHNNNAPSAAAAHQPEPTRPVATHAAAAAGSSSPALGGHDSSGGGISRPTTPTPTNPYAAASSATSANASSTTLAGASSNVNNASASGSGVEQVKVRSGLLKIRITSGKGLRLPDGVGIPESVQRAVAQHGPGSMSASSPSALALQQRAARSGQSLGSSRDLMARKQQWWLPYVVLEFDKNEVLVDALGGDLSSPVWMYSATFDVSRASEVSLQIYLRNASPSSMKTSGVLGEDGPGDDSANNAEMGNQDLCLGGVRFTPDLDSDRLMDDWLPLNGQGDAGAVHVQMAFKPTSAGAAHLTIDSFELLKVIGKGSFGKVMQVRKRDTLRIYALKTIRKAHIVSRSEVTHTLAERTVLAKVNNPFIVPLKFSFQSKEKLYLVLAFVNGGELFHHLQREGKFNEQRSRFYAAELLCALEHLHAFNVIYRDLKPENILLDYTGHIALCDFGLCKLNMSESDTTNTFCGTPEYLAPELLQGQGYTKCVDWWTLGVLLYEMLTGLPPFYDENTNEMYRKILQDPLRFPDEVGKEARSLLTLLLNRDPKQRLGVNGAQDIKNHPFFARHIDWKQLVAKKIQPPFKPAVASAIDTSNFDEEFTSEVPLDSVVDDSHLSQTVQRQFEGFSWSQSPLGESVGRY